MRFFPVAALSLTLLVPAGSALHGSQVASQTGMAGVTVTVDATHPWITDQMAIVEKWRHGLARQKAKQRQILTKEIA